MTVFCDRCGTIPLNYIVIDKWCLCMKCADELYIIKLKELNKKFGKV